MQSRHAPRRPDQEAQVVAMARSQDAPLSDWALVTLLGGAYVACLTAFLSVVYAVNQLL